MMTNYTETTAINKTLDGFAGALNAADATSLPSFFTADGNFMPEGVKTIFNPNSLKSFAEQHLASKDFHINFEMVNINVEGNFAFVIALARTRQKDPELATTIEKNSRDFFVFKNVEESWKIHRYMFNNVSVD